MTWRKIEVWFQDGSDENAEVLFDAIADVVHDDPEYGSDAHVSMCLNEPTPGWAKDDDDA